MKKEYILIIVSVVIISYSIVLNIFFPIKKTSTRTYNPKHEKTGIKADFKNAASKYVSDEVVGLSYGYLLGEKDELPAGVEEKMKTVGMAHIIVVSGTHLSIIVMASRKIFFRFSRLAAFYFSVTLLLFYISLIGFSPSVIRASFVAILSLFAWYFGRKQKVYRTVLLTLSFCLAINPYFLTNVSFQLSMLAYSGVVLIMPRMIKYFYGRDKPGFIGSTILSSLSAIIACLPIQMYYFGTFNMIALAANLLILPTIPYVMGVSFLTGIFGLLNAGLIAGIFGKISEFLLTYHVRAIAWLYDKTEFLYEFTKNNPQWLLLYVLIIIFVFAKHNVKICKDDSDNDNNSLKGTDAGDNVF